MLKLPIKVYDHLEKRFRNDATYIGVDGFDNNISSVLFNYDISDPESPTDNSDAEYYDGNCASIVISINAEDTQSTPLYQGDIVYYNDPITKKNIRSEIGFTIENGRELWINCDKNQSLKLSNEGFRTRVTKIGTIFEQSLI